MSWFDRYDDSYRNRGWGQDRASARSGWDGGWGARHRTYEGYSRGTGYDRGYYGRTGYGRTGYGTAGYGYGYDYEYRRRPPEQSPTYGEGGDQAVQRWAQRYGYDVEYEIQPRQGGGGYGTTGGTYGRGTFGGGYGGTARGTAGYGGTGYGATRYGRTGGRGAAGYPRRGDYDRWW